MKLYVIGVEKDCDDLVFVTAKPVYERKGHEVRTPVWTMKEAMKNSPPGTLDEDAVLRASLDAVLWSDAIVCVAPVGEGTNYEVALARMAGRPVYADFGARGELRAYGVKS